MQINFEAEQIKAAHAYVDRLTPIKTPKKKQKVKKDVEIDENIYSTIKEDKPSFIKSILNFLFK
jgi:hypothetical protein